MLDQGRTPRRLLLVTVAGLGAGCLAGCLAGCGPDAAAPAAPRAAPAEALLPLDQLRPGVPVVVSPPGRSPVVLVRAGSGTVRGFSAVCPHQGCVVEVLDGGLVCPCHNSRFEPTTGARIRGLTPRSLGPVPVRVLAGQVWLE